MSAKIPSEAQAKLLARSWSADALVPVAVNGYVAPTTKACVRHGWLAPTPQMGVYPNGDGYVKHIVSPEGLFALERFLWKRRMAT